LKSRIVQQMINPYQELCNKWSILCNRPVYSRTC